MRKFNFRSFHDFLFLRIATFSTIFTKNKIKLFVLSDLVACAAPIGIFLGRIANFINGELVGRTTQSKLGMIFPHIDNEPRHPSQIYEALNALGSTAWSINQDVYRIIEAIWAWGGGVCDIPPRLNFQVPEPLRPGFVLYSPSPGRLLLGTRPKSDIRKR